MSQSTLHIKLGVQLSNLPSELEAPVINIPLADPVGMALELGLQLIPDRAKDGNPELVAKGAIKLPVTKIFGREIAITEAYEVDVEVFITTADDAALAEVDAHIDATNQS